MEARAQLLSTRRLSRAMQSSLNEGRSSRADIHGSWLQGKRVLITGASGFIGTHLCCRLLKEGAEVCGLSRSKPGIDDVHLHWRQADLTSADITRRAFEELHAEIVFHLCSHAQGGQQLEMVLPTFCGELMPTVNILEAVAEFGVERIVTAGSLEEPELGDPPVSPYAAKAASRLYERLFHRLYSTPVVMTRIFMTYGPGQADTKIVPHCIRSLLQGRPLSIGSPARAVDWIYVDDVVEGLLAAAVAPGLEGKSIDLGSGRMVTIGAMVRKLQRIIKSHTPVDCAAVVARRFERVCCADVARTRKLTGWKPVVSLSAGLERTVAYQALRLGIPFLSTAATE